MADWKNRAEVAGDVVFFRYASAALSKGTDEVFVWDLDKTYLDTTLDSLSALWTTIVERAFHKKNVPGTRALLQALSKDWTKNKGQLRFPIFFITASPPQMEERISEKFVYDEIRPLGCFYKDNLRNLHPKRLWKLNKQVGYKVQALLQLRTFLKEEVKQVLFGDDSEADAIIYSLYSDICARRLGPQELRQILKSLSVANEQIDEILRLQTQVPENDPVGKIYINLAVDTDADYYLKFGRRTLPTENSFQLAIDLFQDSRLSLAGVQSVAQDLVYNYGFTADELLRSFEDLIRRKVLGVKAVEQIVPYFIERGLFYGSYKPSFEIPQETQIEKGQVLQLQGQFEPWIPDRVDYFHDYR